MSAVDFVAAWTILVGSFALCLLASWALLRVARELLDLVGYIRLRLRIRSRARRAAAA